MRIRKPEAFSWAEVCARRLERNGLVPPAGHSRPADIVRAMCGAHAQVPSAAELSIGIRSLGISQEEIRRGLGDERSLVKTYGPRGTVHLLPAEDLPLWTAALGAIPLPAAVQQRFLTLAQAEEVIFAIADALRAAELTAAELGDAVVAQTGPWAGELVMPAFNGMWPRWRAVLAQAAFRGALCFGNERGRRVTYTNPANVLPGFQPVAADSGLAWLVRSYLFSYGPATPAHFAQWLSADRHWAAELFDSMSGELMPATIDGVPGGLVAGDVRRASEDPSCVRLLPYFDAFIVGSQPRDRLFAGEAAQRGLSRGQAGNFPVVLIDGVVGGLWHQRRSGRRVEITAELFRPLRTPQKDELMAQADRIGGFLRADASLAIGPIRARAHA
jgi:hypothetical protein